MPRSRRSRPTRPSPDITPRPQLPKPTWPSQPLCIPDISKTPLEEPKPYPDLTLTAQASTFPFLSLPGEMRNLIYSYYLGPRRTFAEIEAGKDGEGVVTRRDPLGPPHKKISANIDERNLVQEPIIRVSRQIRLEALPLLIQNTCFRVQWTQTFDFLGLFGTAHVTTVRYVDSCPAGGWDLRMLKAIAACPKLRRLKLELRLGYHRESMEEARIIEKDMARPEMLEVMKIRGLKEMVFQPVVTCVRPISSSSIMEFRVSRIEGQIKAAVETNAIEPKVLR